jgi:translation initiation factor eIF-2B subunit gamma
MGFQAVLMAGGHGNRMSPLTNQQPKALLPIGNVPMIIYSLKMLEKVQFTDAIVIAKEEIARTLPELFEEHNVTLKVDVTEIPDDSDIGTAEALALIKDKIHSDFIVLSSDLVTDASLHRLVDQHRLHGATVTALFAQNPARSEEEKKAEKKAAGGDITKGMTDFVAIEQGTSRLIFFENQADLVDEDRIPFRKSVLKKHPQINVFADLLDAHVYVFAKWVIDFVAATPGLMTIKGELLPYLVRKQFSNLSKNGAPSELRKHIPASSFQDNYGVPVAKGTGEKNPLKCFAYVLPAGTKDVPGPLCIRANTLQLYCEANRMVTTKRPKLLNRDAKELPMVDPSVSLPDAEGKKIGGDCMLGAGTKVGERCTFKRSIIGKHCVIGEKVQISDSIIMNHITIGDGCVIKNSVVCNDTHIATKCSLTHCQIGTSCNVPEGTTKKNTQIVPEVAM